MNCNGCTYYRYESDTNYTYCIKTPFDEERMELSDCPDYYNKDDASADAKYGDCDRY